MRLLSIAGLVIATLLGFVTSVWEAFVSPLAVQWTSGGHAHFVRLPVALVAAVVGNVLLAWMAYTVTGRMLAIGAPFVAWTVPMVFAAGKTTEGDLILTSNNWVGLGTMLVGAVTYAAAVYWLTIRSLRQPRDPVVTEPVWRDAADAR